ncbi:TRAF-type zinc finger domain-containing protein 1 [Danaus plexippus plexippus]|uniref:TRAF-type zinc finger domain-containing protein 1 n=1 Tax=Danaus plexippus plexippus TaxID=278856 RepID=A0A212FMZ8_DANPL|nr:bromodomain-containing protein 4A-like isoform X2 [Danaus plexippus plexippus]OWR55107.1 TRAF-type zinc finger domain-containing protein 1 [Danaus plexippus plexippus]
MEEAENKVCHNCKREIPLANFTIHAVHCARNIRLCPVCKEPVPVQDLQQHHDDQHKLVPCKQCGEDVCGTDMEDHVRDSCALTMQTCRFCTLELRRRELPAHERYCGARTELCECGEWVMMKYRQLHIDSNHGFIRLDDDPVPIQSIKASVSKQKVTTDKTPLSNGLNNLNRSAFPRKNNSRDLNTAADQTASTSSQKPTAMASTSKGNSSKTKEENITNANGAIPRAKRIERQHPGNDSKDKVKNSSSRGSMKKRPAPPPPASSAPVLQAALQRQQREETQRQLQNQENLARGLPPILNPAEKLERLRKMDALHQREPDDQSWKNRLQGRVWSRPHVYPIGHVLSGQTDVAGEVRKELKNLKPMTPEEFNDRYRNIQSERQDRFKEIKTSLRELRRGLNEVIAPYNSNSNADTNHSRHEEEAPCEFCGTSVLLEDLVLHQTGCRPDLAQYRSPPPSPGPRPPAEPPAPQSFPLAGSPRASHTLRVLYQIVARASRMPPPGD